MFSSFVRVAVCLLFWLPSIAFSAETRSIHIEWGYTPPSEPKVTGFRLYQEGAFVCEELGAQVSSMDCDVTLVADLTNFTLTATFADGTESLHSAPFPFSKVTSVSTSDDETSSAASLQDEEIVSQLADSTTDTSLTDSTVLKSSASYAALSLATSSVATTTLSSSTYALVALHLEVGVLQLTSAWQHVSFEEPYDEPVVVASPPSFKESDPCLVSIANVSAEGFDIRLNEWPYLDGAHLTEKVSYMVLEKGRALLEDGSAVEAGTFIGSGSWQDFSFLSSFAATPIVLTSVASVDTGQAIAGRIVPTSTGFSYRLQGQESLSDTDTASLAETVHYIAWEAGEGALGDVQYEAVSAATTLTDAWKTVSFSSDFLQTPVFFPVIQSKNEMDPVSLRIQSATSIAMQIQLQEEQSLDYETYHATEDIAYLAFAATGPVRLATFNWQYDQEKENDILGYRVFANDEELCETYDVTARSLICTLIGSEEVIDFALTTIDSDDDAGGASNIISYRDPALMRLATFTWEFDEREEDDIAGFRILANGASICTTDDPTARTLSCTLVQPTTATAFTVQAITTEGELSSSSNAITYAP